MPQSVNASHNALHSPSEPIWRSLTIAVKSAIAGARQRAQARRDYQRLHVMSDHELEDIGLTRDMIRRAERDLDRMPFGPV